MPFLRTIKRGLLGNKDFNNYLLYAVGELVLVVAGFLFAEKAQSCAVRTITYIDTD